MRSIRSLRRSALALLAALAVPSSAAALPLEDPITGLRLQVESPGAEVCRILPPAAPSEAGACEGMDIDAIKQATSGEKRPTAVAVLRFEGWGAVVAIKGIAGTTLVAKETIEEFLGGFRKSMPGNSTLSGDRPGTTYDLVKLNDVNAIRTTVLLGGQGPSAGGKLRTYAFTSQSGTAALSFAGPPEHSAELIAVADKIAATVSMPRAEVRNFGKPRAEILSEALGHLTGALLPVIGGVIALIVMFAKRAKKKEAR